MTDTFVNIAVIAVVLVTYIWASRTRSKPRKTPDAQQKGHEWARQAHQEGRYTMADLQASFPWHHEDFDKGVMKYIRETIDNQPRENPARKAGLSRKIKVTRKGM